MYYKLLGTVGGVSRGYEVNEDFISHFAGREAISLENYQNLRRQQKKSVKPLIPYLSMEWVFHR